MRALIKERRLSWRSGLDLVASIAMVAVAGTLLLGGRIAVVDPAPQPTPPKVPEAPLSLDGLAVMGSRTAPAGLILYSDFQCPFCRRFARDVLPVVERELVESGQLLLAFKHLPLESIHPHAFAAASLAECGRREGKFWLVHDGLFAEPKLTSLTIQAIAERMAIASKADCLDLDGPRVVREHGRDALALGITATPTLLVGAMDPNGHLVAKTILSGFQSVEAITAAVKSANPGAR